MTDRELLRALAETLRGGKSSGKVLVGFDGYIDRVVRLKKNQKSPPELFNSIGELSKRIQEHRGRSLDIAVQRQGEKIGGNGILMAESLGKKGIPTTCIGAIGYPQPGPAFYELSMLCSLISVEDPAFTLALEFNDAKLMLAEAESLDRINWDRLCTVIGKDKITALIAEADIFAFANWSGLSQSNDILSAITKVICPALEKKKRLLFFDLADPSCKTQEQFTVFFRHLEALRSCFDISLGLNSTETVMVYNRLFNSGRTSFCQTMARELVSKTALREVIVHGTDWAFVADKEGCREEIRGIKVDAPAILTGAGDNFNAGYCLGKLYSLGLRECLYLGNISATLYVKNGIPAELTELAEFADMRSTYEYL
jgi:sugar/nucleoside kinase (ribokinase family)